MGHLVSHLDNANVTARQISPHATKAELNQNMFSLAATNLFNDIGIIKNVQQRYALQKACGPKTTVNEHGVSVSHLFKEQQKSKKAVVAAVKTNINRKEPSRDSRFYRNKLSKSNLSVVQPTHVSDVPREIIELDQEDEKKSDAQKSKEEGSVHFT